MKTVRDKHIDEYNRLRREEQMRVNNEYGRVVQLSDPLPCGIWTGPGGEVCGRPATAAYLDSDPSDAGAYKLRPVCRDCAAAAAAVYGGEDVS